MTPGSRPRVLLVLPEHWPRALLRAELVERGYDAVGAPDLGAAVRLPPAEAAPEPVRLIVVDQAVVREADRWLLDLLVARQGRPLVLLLAHGGSEVPAGPWHRVVRRPVPIGEIATAVEDLVPRNGRGAGAPPGAGGS